MEKIRIGILGIGGTGGFFGGKLARHYERDRNTEIIFIARNEAKRRIQHSGLFVESVDGDFTARPDVVSDDTDRIGALDILLVCVKSYGLLNAVKRYGENVKKGGVAITIQNLVNQQEQVEQLLPPGAFLLEGCAYIISNIVDVGRIKHKGGPATIYFGRNGDAEPFNWVQEVFVNAGIKATLSNDISKTIWRKFLFISPLAVATSSYSCSIGGLRSDPEKMRFLKGLMEELLGLTHLNGLRLTSEDIEHHLAALEGFPENGRTSMQLDIESGKPSEIDALLNYVLAEGKKYNLALSNYKLAWKRLAKKQPTV